MGYGQGSFFDEADSSQTTARPIKPIWTLNLDDDANDKEILTWLNAELGYLKDQDQERITQQQRNLALLKGNQYQEIERRGDVRDRGDDRSRAVKKIVANHLYDLLKNRASRLLKYKPAVAFLPTNDEFEDKIAAKSVKALTDHIWYENNYENQVTVAVANHALAFGESYLFIEWDPDKGDLSPAYKKAAKKHGEKIPLLNESGEQEKDPQGNPVFIDRVVRVGDVNYRVKLATEVYPERKKSWPECNFLFEEDSMPVEELRALYPDAASKIKETNGVQIYDYEKMELVSGRREVIYHTFYHKRHRMMDKGRKIVFTRDAILSNTEFPYSHWDLPCVRLTDVDFPGELHGRSFFDIVKGLTGTYNNLTNLILRNQILASHPKWVVPAGSTQIDQLGNDITVVQFKGPQAPQLVQSNPTPAEVFNFRAALKEEFQQLSGGFGVSRGEPPPGIKAGIALQFLSEQENERFNELVLKWNEFQRQVAIQTMAVCGDYYDESDERFIRVLGKNNAWMSQFFNVAALEKDYDVRVQNSSALPQSKAARNQFILDLNQQFPNQFPPEQVIDILDLSQSDKFVDMATISVRSAEAENEKLLDAKSLNEAHACMPQDFEDHILHWKTHVRQIREYSYKYQTPGPVKQGFKDHILVHEMMMWDHGKKNPAFQQQLGALPDFPIFFVPDELAQQTEIPQAQPAGKPPIEGAPQAPELPVNLPGTPAVEPSVSPAAEAEKDAGAMDLPPAIQQTGSI